MKFFLFLVVVLVGAWFWRQRSLKRDRQKANAKPSAPSGQHIMLSCSVCGVHVPDNEAVAGQRGAYCSAEHRRQAEDL